MNKRIVLITGLLLIMAIVLAACNDEQLLLGQDYNISESASGEPDADTGSEETSDGGTSGQTDILYVHVCGAVNEPGVYELSAGSRINDAVLCAGGFDSEADRESINLVEQLEDGQQIRIPFIGEQEMSPDSGLIDINSAGAEILCTIPGIGETRAAAIIAYREEHGGFRQPEDLMKVSGIKEGLYARIKPYIECR